MRLVQARAPFWYQNDQKVAEVQNNFTAAALGVVFGPLVSPLDTKITPNHVLAPLEGFGSFKRHIMTVTVTVLTVTVIDRYTFIIVLS